jgi:hypothetical protein
MEPNQAVDRRDELIREACRAAGERLARCTAPAPAIIATGELLFWIVAADDSMLRSGRPGYAAYRNDGDLNRKLLMQGLRYPRNVLAHDSEAWELGISDGYVDVYADMYGVWTWVSLSAPGAGAKPHVATQHDAYETRLAGQPVISTAREALEMLEEFWTRQ